MRGGLDADSRDTREHIFGMNLIDIHQKSALQLLVDEVGASFIALAWYGQLINKGFSSLLHIPSRQSHSLVNG